MSHPVQYRVYRFLRPLKQRFDTAVVAIAYPAVHAASPCLALHVMPEPDALHTPENAQMKCVQSAYDVSAGLREPA